MSSSNQVTSSKRKRQEDEENALYYKTLMYQNDVDAPRGGHGTVLPVFVSNDPTAQVLHDKNGDLLSANAVAKVYRTKPTSAAALCRGRMELGTLRHVPVHRNLVQLIGEDQGGEENVVGAASAAAAAAGNQQQVTPTVALLYPFCAFGDVITYMEAFAAHRPRGGAYAMSWFELAFISVQLLDAIRALNAAGLCHLDIKPDNILIDRLVLVRPSEMKLVYTQDGGLDIESASAEEIGRGKKIGSPEQYEAAMQRIAQAYAANPARETSCLSPGENGGAMEHGDSLLLLPFIRLADYDASRHVTASSINMGTVQYSSPEVLRKSLRLPALDHAPIINEALDMFSVGVTLWMCSAGAAPWRSTVLENPNSTPQQKEAASRWISNNIARDVNLSTPLPGEPQQPFRLLQNFLLSMMDHNTSRRLGAVAALAHPYLECVTSLITRGKDEFLMCPFQLPEPYMQEMIALMMEEEEGDEGDEGDGGGERSDVGPAAGTGFGRRSRNTSNNSNTNDVVEARSSSDKSVGAGAGGSSEGRSSSGDGGEGGEGSSSLAMAEGSPKASAPAEGAAAAAATSRVGGAAGGGIGRRCTEMRVTSLNGNPWEGPRAGLRIPKAIDIKPGTHSRR